MEPTVIWMDQDNEKLGDNCSDTRRETAIKRDIDTPFDESNSDKHQNVLNQSVGAKLTGINYSDPVGTNVYMLKAKKNSDSANLRWFEIGQSDLTESDHKIIILMGATGSGKSTLVNGMVNYILGVKWNDPFRFKCIREDESGSRNQAHSQTSSVTAYTIHHQKGMVIPYSITIIDTPGYGDTRGVERDKEITKLIHEFLLMQPADRRINLIHAACFVAASGDSRLTVTQRYIIDSVLSIFGKDFKDNIRLLVTFADNADPPVVEACRAAQFPVTSQSAGVLYSKFNSSVLYASNEQGEDDSSFDQLFWDMGQENFEKFFTMLEEMNGKDLKSTREVIQQRTQIEQSLKEIECKLEVCFVKIEKMREFGRKPDKDCLNELVKTKAKVIHLLEQVGSTGRSLDLTALRSNALSPADYLSLMKSRVAEEQKPGYLTRLETLTELQQSFSINETEPSLSLSPSADCLSSMVISRAAGEQKPAYFTPSETSAEPHYRSSSTVLINIDETCDGWPNSKRAPLAPVIQHRQYPEQPLKDIEHELEILFVKIEKIRESSSKPDSECLNELNQTKANLIQLLEQVSTSGRPSNSTALSPAGYLTLMRSRVEKEQQPGYITRLETLTELQRNLSTVITVEENGSFVSKQAQLKGNNDGWIAFLGELLDQMLQYITRYSCRSSNSRQMVLPVTKVEIDEQGHEHSETKAYSMFRDS